MAWPTLEELKSELGITQTLPPEREVILERALAAAQDQVKIDVAGRANATEYWEDEVDLTPSLEAAALLLAVKITKAPSAPFGVAAVFDAGGLYVAARDPQYRRLLKGHRVAFGVA
jgi:hypothetical protein